MSSYNLLRFSDAAIFGASQKRQRLNGSNHCEIEDKDAVMIARIQAERKKRATNITTQSHSNENPSVTIYYLENVLNVVFD